MREGFLKLEIRGRNRKYEIRNTGSRLMSNAERRVQNVELGKLVSSVIRHPSLVSWFSHLASESTWYIVLGTSYNFYCLAT